MKKEANGNGREIFVTGLAKLGLFIIFLKFGSDIDQILKETHIVAELVELSINDV